MCNCDYSNGLTEAKAVGFFNIRHTSRQKCVSNPPPPHTPHTHTTHSYSSISTKLMSKQSFPGHNGQIFRVGNWVLGTGAEFEVFVKCNCPCEYKAITRVVTNCQRIKANVWCYHYCMYYSGKLQCVFIQYRPISSQFGVFILTTSALSFKQISSYVSEPRVNCIFMLQSVCKSFPIILLLHFLFYELCKAMCQTIHISTIKHPGVIEEVLVARLCTVLHQWLLNHSSKMNTTASCVRRGWTLTSWNGIDGEV